MIIKSHSFVQGSDGIFLFWAKFSGTFTCLYVNIVSLSVPNVILIIVLYIVSNTQN